MTSEEYSERTEAGRSPLNTKLQGLSQNAGVWQPDLYERPGPALCELWKINKNDTVTAVRGKVTEQLKELTSGLAETDRVKESARWSFNLLDPNKWRYTNLEDRQRGLSEERERHFPGRRGNSVSTVKRDFNAALAAIESILRKQLQAIGIDPDSIQSGDEEKGPPSSTSSASVDDRPDSGSSEFALARDRTQPPGGSNDRKRPQPVNPRTVFLSILSAMALTVAATVGGYKWISSDGDKPPKVDPVAQPADASSLPVAVVGISDIVPAPVGSFALAEKLDMSDEELAQFNTNVYSQTAGYSSWFKENEAVPVDSQDFSPIATITLSGNLQEEVRITNMKVIKECGPPLGGTYFSPFSQGSPDNLSIGFNLDEGDPIPQDTSSEPRGTGESFFNSHPITLEPGEKETLSLGFFSQQYFCEFTLRLFVATSGGSIYQDIDASGKNRDLENTSTPFSLTALPSGNSNTAHRGWGRVYGMADWLDENDQFHREWVRVDPKSGKYAIPD
ncbi:hypothetical protein E4N62_36095 [Streptomyces sp. MNU76]|uniref:hypothetical protein n=1 Tax=Streptomyces sp. MNU76 TaxID=2560026 RepID=UPI001E3D9FD3|nr:hypothetical protein [Streptomyces sp. MNU76]MCC9710212.1 hypothetical protein [Streptomyces sp. MNU76]